MLVPGHEQVHLLLLLPPAATGLAPAHVLPHVCALQVRLRPGVALGVELQRRLGWQLCSRHAGKASVPGWLERTRLLRDFVALN